MKIVLVKIIVAAGFVTVFSLGCSVGYIQGIKWSKNEIDKALQEMEQRRNSDNVYTRSH